jgi:hypothetical protein
LSKLTGREIFHYIVETFLRKLPITQQRGGARAWRFNRRSVLLCRALPYLSLTQGTYYLATGLWPILSICTFEAVTGPKTDRWLVKTVGVLVVVSGVVLMLAGFRREFGLEVVVLGVGGAIGLTGIDVWYVARKVVAPIYLLDAVAELILVTLWIITASTSAA